MVAGRRQGAPLMARLVWVSDAQADPELIKFVQTDITMNDADRAIEAESLIKKAASVLADMCPRRIWSDDPKRPLKRVPDLFNSRGYYIVSAKAADILRQYALGGGALHPVVDGVFQNDGTRLPGEFFTWVFGNQKSAVSGPNSLNLRPFAPGWDGWWKMPLVLNDDDIAVSMHALDGPDVWLDPTLFKSIFLSGPLGQALADSGLAKAFRLKRCRVIEGA